MVVKVSCKNRPLCFKSNFSFSLCRHASSILRAGFYMRGSASSNLAIVLQHMFCVQLSVSSPTSPSSSHSVSTDQSESSLLIHGAAEVIRRAAENADYELVTHILIACALVARRSLANSNILLNRQNKLLSSQHWRQANKLFYVPLLFWLQVFLTVRSLGAAHEEAHLRNLREVSGSGGVKEAGWRRSGRVKRTETYQHGCDQGSSVDSKDIQFGRCGHVCRQICAQPAGPDFTTIHRHLTMYLKITDCPWAAMHPHSSDPHASEAMDALCTDAQWQLTFTRRVCILKDSNASLVEYPHTVTIHTPSKGYSHHYNYNDNIWQIFFLTSANWSCFSWQMIPQRMVWLEHMFWTGLKEGSLMWILMGFMPGPDLTNEHHPVTDTTG